MNTTCVVLAFSRFWFAAVVAAFCFATRARAQDSETLLSISVAYDVASDGCPNALAFRALAQGKLPQDIRLASGAPFDWVVSVASESAVFHVAITRADGSLVREVRDPSCLDALEATTTVLALLIEDEVRERQQNARAEQNRRAEEPLVATEDEETPFDRGRQAAEIPPTSQGSTTRLRSQVGVLAAFGALPNWGLGVEGATGVGWEERFFLLAQLRYEANAGEQVIAGVPVFSHSAALALWGGFTLGAIDIGAVVRTGFLWAHTRSMQAGLRDLFTVSAGLRMQGNIFLKSTVALYGAIELLGQFVEVSMLSGTTVIWRNSPVHGVLSLGMRFDG